MPLSSVDLPAPLVPSRATISPWAHVEVDAEEDLHRPVGHVDAAARQQRRRRSAGCSGRLVKRRRSHRPPPPARRRARRAAGRPRRRRGPRRPRRACRPRGSARGCRGGRRRCARYRSRRPNSSWPSPPGQRVEHDEQAGAVERRAAGRRGSRVSRYLKSSTPMSAPVIEPRPPMTAVREHRDRVDRVERADAEARAMTSRRARRRCRRSSRRAGTRTA